jgi:hypothetical protein
LVQDTVLVEQDKKGGLKARPLVTFPDGSGYFHIRQIIKRDQNEIL